MIIMSIDDWGIGMMIDEWPLLDDDGDDDDDDDDDDLGSDLVISTGIKLTLFMTCLQQVGPTTIIRWWLS